MTVLGIWNRSRSGVLIGPDCLFEWMWGPKSTFRSPVAQEV